MKQVKMAIDIFDERFPTHRAAFGFDNAPTHTKRADNALSARHMPKNPGWTGKKAPMHMRPGMLPNGEPQELYFPDNHPVHPGKFKGMAQILRERGLVAEAELPASCLGFKCVDETASCCCRRVLFNQPDFRNQKSALVEYIESRGHIVFFYPKFHCELNFIEQCWGYAKYRYRILPRPASEKEMKQNIKTCLDSIPLETISR